MYEKKSFKDKLISFDVYKKISKNYLQSTYIGAICKFYFLIKYF
jgi:hypothetical protein